MKTFDFQRAVPIWAKEREREMNCELAFRAAISGAEAVLRLTASSIYRVWMNGEFVAAGPARAAHGFYRVDEISLTPYLKLKRNTLVVEVVAFNVNSYDTLDQPGFLTAEVIQNDKVTAATGDASFAVFDLHERIQRIQRYSFQRAFGEAYRLAAEKRGFYLGSMDAKRLEAAIQPDKRYLVRELKMPDFERLPAEEVIRMGRVRFDIPCAVPIRDRAYTNIGPKLKGYRMEELEEHLSDETQTFAWEEGMERPATPACVSLQNGYALYRFAYNATGFIRLHVQCEQACVVYLLFDEILTDGDVDFLRLTNCNCFKYYLGVGEHSIMSFAPYTMMYLKAVVKGACTISDVSIIEYQHPEPAVQIRIPDNQALCLIRDSAVRTFRQNALDVFMDCPSRERAGWLCDSFFTARVEYVLTGTCTVEKVFLENFLLADQFEHLPEGMLPMCYPADHYDGVFIPNWAMWFVLELEEYLVRSGDTELIIRAKKRVFDLLRYLETFENADGLLERLPSWVFVEWSAANDWVQDVNFPSNMLYARMLQAVARLYQEPGLLKKSSSLREVIRKRSYNGHFFTDHEVIENGQYQNPGHQSEVCQYYAFFTGIADRQTDPELWETLVKAFGPGRAAECYPQVTPANAFIGDYLRLELLFLDGRVDTLLKDLQMYFQPMAEKTGTLWEHNLPSASCCHGFASHVLYWLAKIYGTENDIHANA